jgi:hypothetical protein
MRGEDRRMTGEQRRRENALLHCTALHQLHRHQFNRHLYLICSAVRGGLDI